MYGVKSQYFLYACSGVKVKLVQNINNQVLAQRDRKHRDIYTGENKRHIEGVETITGTGETDQGVTLS